VDVVAPAAVVVEVVVVEPLALSFPLSGRKTMKSPAATMTAAATISAVRIA
jgi:hypothetical protein